MANLRRRGDRKSSGFQNISATDPFGPKINPRDQQPTGLLHSLTRGASVAARGIGALARSATQAPGPSPYASVAARRAALLLGLPTGETTTTPRFKKRLLDLRLLHTIDEDAFNYYSKHMNDWENWDILGRQGGVDGELLEALLPLTANDPKSGWRLVRRVGKGGFGAATLWQNYKHNDVRVIVKDAYEQMAFWRDYNHEGLLTQRLYQAGCDNVIEIYDWLYSEKDKTFRMLMEYAEFGDLSRIIKFYRYNNLVLPETFIWTVARDIADFLCYMAYGQNTAPERVEGWEPIIHNDLNPSNIFLTSSKEPGAIYPTVKVGDFGGAYQIPMNEPSKTAVINLKKSYSFGTRGYLPPERLEAEAPGTDSDVWNMGTILWDMVQVAIDKVEKFDREFYRDWSQGDDLARENFIYDPELLRVIKACTHGVKWKRPEIYTLLRDVIDKHIKEKVEPITATVNPKEWGPYSLLYCKDDQTLFEDDQMFQENFEKMNEDMLRAQLKPFHAAKKAEAERLRNSLAAASSRGQPVDPERLSPAWQPRTTRRPAVQPRPQRVVRQRSTEGRQRPAEKPKLPEPEERVRQPSQQRQRWGWS
ncbi:MAG: hypothetical protein M1834_006866 [Cirrosporium novae-zelandiae]|nr:MAG: hypothetical protein M1834_006866 [Cirrosporium novae-zelandiae]